MFLVYYIFYTGLGDFWKGPLNERHIDEEVNNKLKTENLYYYSDQNKRFPAVI